MIIKKNDVTIKVSNTDLMNNDEQAILNSIIDEDPTIYWSDDSCKHWFFDFIIGIKNNKNVWCEALHINNELNEYELNLYQ